MTDARYRIRIVPATKGTAWKVVSPEGKTVSVGTDPADAIDRMPRLEFLRAFVWSLAKPVELRNVITLPLPHGNPRAIIDHVQRSHLMQSWGM